MKKIISSFFIFLAIQCFAFSNVYDSPQNLDIILVKLPELKSIKCKFKQEKYLKNISKPIISSGDFEFVKNKGVYFTTTYPIQAQTNYTNKNYKQINEIINAISSKKYSKIEKEFDFYYEDKKSDWILGICPKSKSQSAEFISYITLSGQDYINKIEIKQTNGNKIILWLTK